MPATSTAQNRLLFFAAAVYRTIEANKAGLKQSIFLDVYGCHTVDSKPVKQEVNSTMILPHLVFPGKTFKLHLHYDKVAFG